MYRLSMLDLVDNGSDQTEIEELCSSGKACASIIGIFIPTLNQRIPAIAGTSVPGRVHFHL